MSDTCQTPGCGHARQFHAERGCHYELTGKYNEIGRTYWHGEPVFIQGHTHSEPICAWPDCQTYLPPAPTETVSEPCACGHVDHTSGHFGWCMERGCPCIQFRPGREQVLADEQAAWDVWNVWGATVTNTPMIREAWLRLCTGYLAGNGIDHE